MKEQILVKNIEENIFEKQFLEENMTEDVLEDMEKNDLEDLTKEKKDQKEQKEQINWTLEQERAIKSRGKNLLVSASAGSGKTAILIERIKRLILEEGVSIDSMLIVTYTNAAAREMKEKLKKSLRKELSREDLDKEKRKIIKGQLALIPTASIGTFHSFYQKIIKRFSFLRDDLEGSYKILTGGKENVLRNEAFDELIESIFQNSLEPNLDIKKQDEGNEKLENLTALTDCKEEQDCKRVPDSNKENAGYNSNNLGRVIRIDYEALYRKQRLDIYSFFDNYTNGRGFDPVKEVIFNIYDKILGFSKPFLWLDEKVEFLDLKENEENIKILVRWILGYLKYEFSELEKKITENISFLEAENRRIFDIYQNECLNSQLKELRQTMIFTQLEPIRNILEIIEKIENSEKISVIEGYEKVTGYYKIFSENMPKGKDSIYQEYTKKSGSVIKALKDDALKNEVIEVVKVCKENNGSQSKKDGYFENLETIKKYFSESIETNIEFISMTYDTGRILEFLLKEYDKIYKEKKREQSYLTFSDLEHIAYELLSDAKLGVSEYYKEKYEYIFIDEFQDTNEVQVDIVKCFSRRNNVFVVGDLKQSIYKFRGTEPKFFVDFRKEYEKDTKYSEVIDLNVNFRSKKSILDYTNNIFISNMDGYEGNVKLRCLAGHQNEENIEPTLTVIRRDKEDEYELSNAEVEAKYIAKKIEELIKNKTLIYDDKAEGNYRPAGYGDIAVLTRTNKNGVEIKNALAEKGISYVTEEKGDFFGEIEVRIAIDLLSVIDNRMQDIRLMAVMTSPIFSFSLDELSKIRIAFPKGSYYDAICFYMEEGEDEKLKKKIEKFFARLDMWKEDSIVMELDQFLWKVFIDSGYYLIVSSMDNGERRLANLEKIVELSNSSRDKMSKSLYWFLSMIESMKKYDSEIEIPKIPSKEDEAVKIMTVHKSKGLEFPIVFLTGLIKEHAKSTFGTNGIFVDKNRGIAIEYKNREEGRKYKDIYSNYLIDMNNLAEEEEEKRLFYVALTRAKDRLNLVSCIKGEEYEKYQSKKGFISLISKAEAFDRSMFKEEHFNFVEAKSFLDEDIEFVDDEDKEEDACKSELIDKIGKDSISIKEAKLQEQFDKKKIVEILEYKYPYEDATKKRISYSVSQLNDEMIEENFDNNPLKNLKYYKAVLNTPKFLMNKKKYSPSEKGTIYHKILEEIDFKKVFTGDPDELKESIAVEESIKKEEIKEVIAKNISVQIEAMISQGLLLENEYKAIDMEKIYKFFFSKLGQRAIIAAKKDRLFKERSFLLEEKSGEDKIVIKGEIDCYFEEDGEFVLIDYKTNYIDERDDIDLQEDKLVKRYKNQIAIYKKALEEGGEKKVKEAYLYFASIGSSRKVF